MSRVCAVLLTFLLAMLPLAQAATTYHVQISGAENSPGLMVRFNFTTSGAFAGHLQLNLKQENGKVTEGDWLLTTSTKDGIPAGTLAGTIQGGTVTFDVNNRVAGLVDTALAVTSGTGRFAETKAGTGTLGGSTDPARAIHAPDAFHGVLTLTL